MFRTHSATSNFLDSSRPHSICIYTHLCMQPRRFMRINYSFKPKC
jgi:hypothetical protein